MGISYTICYCTYNKKCKSRFGEKKEDTFDEAHWGEIRDNTKQYLADDVCVPGAEKQVRVPFVVVELLNTTLSSLTKIRSADPTKPEDCLAALSSAHEAVSRISYLCHQINAAPADKGLRLSASLQRESDASPSVSIAESSGDPFLETAAILVVALHRSIYELMESKKTGDSVYIFHHLAIVFDTTQELYRLLVEAMGHIGSERFLPQEHQHYGLLEQRWERDGV